MKLHVLPGDSLTDRFRETGIDGETAICRECLIEGDVKADSLDVFWHLRASFLSKTYPEFEQSYFDNVVPELAKIQDLPAGSEVNLWFEHELFCQVNLWFCLSLLAGTKADVFRVEPCTTEIWKGFGNLVSEDLAASFSARRRLSPGDIELGKHLWTAYQNADYPELSRLSKTASDRFPHLEEVCLAEIEKATRPLQILDDIRREGISAFPDVFAEFSRRAGIYGYGDSQVKRLIQTS
ncbi:MAG: hypothetical protein WKF92_02885 [Pyrinomonadaceae bacterium]